MPGYLVKIMLLALSLFFSDESNSEMITREVHSDFPIPLKEGNTWIYRYEYFQNDSLHQVSIDTVTLGPEIKFDGKRAWEINEYSKYVLVEPDTLYFTERLRGGGEKLHLTIVVPGKADTTYFSYPIGGDAISGVNRSKMYEITSEAYSNRKVFKKISEMETFTFHTYSENLIVDGIGYVEGYSYRYSKKSTYHSYTKTTLISYMFN